MSRQRRPSGDSDDLLAKLPVGLPGVSTGPIVPLGSDGHRRRMRQKLLTAGGDALADHELLEMTLFVALPRRDTKPIARELLRRFGSFAGVVAAPLPELLGVTGLGESGAAALKTIHAAANRFVEAERLFDRDRRSALE